MPKAKRTASRGSDVVPESPSRGRIISAAFHGFVENGFADTTMLQIASRAKVSKRDLYANFPNKEAVLMACIADRAARMRLPDLPAPDSRASLETILMQFGRTVIREVCDNAVTAVYRLAVGEAQRSTEVAKVLNASRSANRQALARLLGEAQANRILGPGNAHEMVEDFLALLWGDLMFERLIGAADVPKPPEIEWRARKATQALLKLYSPGAA